MRTTSTVLGLALWAAAALGQDRTRPNDTAFVEKSRGLDEGNDKATRLESLRWLEQNHREPGARLALPALERFAREAPEPELRQRAVRIVGFIEHQRKAPCPLMVLEALWDKGGDVRYEAAVEAGLFRTFAPGSVDLLLRGARDEDPWRRGTCISFLGRAAGKDPKALAVIEEAKRDPVLDVRDLAHHAAFVATDRLEPYLIYLIRLREAPEAILAPFPADAKAREEERKLRNLLHIGSVLRFGEWGEGRADEFAMLLMKLLRDESPLMRRGAAKVITVSLEKRPAPAKPAFPWDYSKGTQMVSPSDLLPFLDPKETITLFKSPGTAPKEKEKALPKVPPQKSAVAVRLEELKVVEALRDLADRDPDQGVREAARQALERLASLGRRKP
jgi:hypothetical protein